MHIECPHCRNPIDIVLDQHGSLATTQRPGEQPAPGATVERPVELITCPLCGSSISLFDPNQTTSYREQEVRAIGRFKLIEHLGSGHFGDVWLAHDSTLDRQVALKVPRKGELDRNDVEMFLREARSAAQLQHPNIVHLHEVGKAGELIFIVSELIRGVNLQDWLTGRALAPAESAVLCATLADALHHAHEAGVVHRDLKPANVLMDADGQPHVTDFGLAKREGAEITMTVDGRIIGTPAYMSPEQARGDAHNADRRSDVYSLGVILYELLTGTRPFLAKSKMLMIHQVLHEEPRVPRRIKRSVPRDLETICLKALAKDPARRYQTAREMADDLSRYREGKPILARPVSPLEKAWRSMRRNPLTAAGIAVISALIASLAGQAWLNQPLRHTVLISTVPAGAQMYFFPLDADDGHPLPEKRVKGGTSPIRAKLAPGEYLVVAVLPDGRFHEVFRHVPVDPSERPLGGHAHVSWENPATGTVLLTDIPIPALPVTNDMTRFEGSDDFPMGSAKVPGSPPHRRRIVAYFLDPTEVTFGDFRRKRKAPIPDQIKNANLQDSDPLVFVSYDQAVAYAEEIGKRLPDEAEYEFAASNGGTTSFPWGDDPEAVPEWQFGPVRIEPLDRLKTNPPVFGLYSNVAEWTSSFGFYPTSGPRYRFPDLDNLRTVRGGSTSVVERVPQPKEWKLGVRSRIGMYRNNAYPGLGLRCARSTRPRLLPPDFNRVVTPQ